MLLIFLNKKLSFIKFFDITALNIILMKYFEFSYN
jgi:hypothetical protein